MVRTQTFNAGEGCRRLPEIQHLNSPGAYKAADAALLYRHVIDAFWPCGDPGGVH
jgi:hypothetical protein